MPGKAPDACSDLVERQFFADAPDRLWVANIPYCRTFAGWVYAAFVIDVCSRRVVGWQLSTSIRTDLARNALDMGLWTREHEGTTPARWCTTPAVAQYVIIRCTERLAEAGVVASVGSKGGSYDNAMAEAFDSLFKTNSSGTAARGRTSTTSRSPSLNKSTGSTSAVSTARSSSSRLSSTRPCTDRLKPSRPARATRSAAVSSVH